ncbi:MAG: hypothetical protein IT254_06960 [Chitinophagaceae bacterium]|nr:hypothetical protein [Bacteroidota bacterium]MCC6258043.1 hypothetical protein [Chitinophagaceae bacterium]MCW5916637.1 hypothetical protein [Ferruginibacter sp.]
MLGYFFIISGFLISGFLLSRAILYFLFKYQVGGAAGDGWAGHMIRLSSHEAGYKITDSILQDDKIRKSLAGDALLQKIRPEISTHIDQFLDVKLKAIFPLLSQFMGAKTRDQLKGAFMDEMDRLFPELMEKLYSGLLNRDNMAEILSGKINSVNLSDSSIRGWINKNIRPRLDLFCSAFMLMAGVITCILHSLLIGP